MCTESELRTRDNLGVMSIISAGSRIVLQCLHEACRYLTRKLVGVVWLSLKRNAVNQAELQSMLRSVKARDRAALSGQILRRRDDKALPEIKRTRQGTLLLCFL